MRALRKEPPKPTTQPLPSLRRAFSLYDQINLIDNVPEDQLRFQGYLFTFSISFLPPISSSFLHYPMWRLKAKALCCIDFQFPSSNFNPCMSRNEISMNIRCLFIYRCWRDTLNYENFVLGKLAFSWFGFYPKIVLGTISEIEFRPTLSDLLVTGLNVFIWDWWRHHAQNLNFPDNSVWILKLKLI